MKTEFTKRQLKDKKINLANDALRRCVHCGLCTATCSSYVVTKDERDSPRGRIYLIKEMLESKKAPSQTLIHHMDRCLTCLSCVTTCPSGVDYLHLSDIARVEIEKRGRRSFIQRNARRWLGRIMPYPGKFAIALHLGRLVRPFRSVFRALGLKEVAAMLDLIPKRAKQRAEFRGGGVARPRGQMRKRVILMTGCLQKTIRPAINDASIRLMAQQGIEVVVAPDGGCCGAIEQHMGKEKAAIEHAKRNIRSWQDLLDDGPVDGIIINASGCGTFVKDYDHILGDHKIFAPLLRPFKDKIYDISEFMIDYDLGTSELWSNIHVAIHIPCSMTHGQQISTEPATLLKNAGFTVSELDEAHICCGSAGTFNVLQPEIANSLGQRKAEHIKSVKPDLLATGNLGCLTQLAHHTSVPVVHYIELLDWAYGGPVPDGLEHLKDRVDYLSSEAN